MAQNERWIYIRNKVAEALKTIRANPKYDWTREPGEAQCAAAENLRISMELYRDEKQSEAEIKAAYTAYVQTYQKGSP